jgi:hypothetical protein
MTTSSAPEKRWERENRKMRLTKMFGLAAVAAVAAMAFVGTTSAMATFNTSLCSEASAELACPAGKQVAEFSMKAGVTKLLGSNGVLVLCLTSKGTGAAESGVTLGNPLLYKLTELVFLNCGTNAEHTNCTVTTEQLPLIKILKTAADLGTATVNPALPAKVHVVCSGFIDCTYSEPAEGKSFAIESAGHTEGSGNGMLTANELQVEKLAGGFLCPKSSKWTALYEPLTALYIRS